VGLRLRMVGGNPLLVQRGGVWFVTEKLDEFAVDCKEVWELLMVLKLEITACYVIWRLLKVGIERTYK
jgi:hypothetical protein